MNMTICELNSAAVALAELIIKECGKDDLKFVIHFVSVLLQALRSYT
jgi:hypothetical protein